MSTPRLTNSCTPTERAVARVGGKGCEFSRDTGHVAVAHSHHLGVIQLPQATKVQEKRGENKQFCRGSRCRDPAAEQRCERLDETKHSSVDGRGAAAQPAPRTWLLQNLRERNKAPEAARSDLVQQVQFQKENSAVKAIMMVAAA